MRPVFIILYLSLLGLYLFVETGDSLRRRAVNKILLSSLFLFFGQFWFWTNGYARGWQFMALVGMFYACMGDALLLFSFGAGGAAFAPRPTTSTLCTSPMSKDSSAARHLPASCRTSLLDNPSSGRVRVI